MRFCPTGIATDDTTSFFFSDLVERGSLVSLYSFENEEKVFPAVHNEFKFCLLTIAGSSVPQPASELVFFARQVSDLADHRRRFALTSNDFALLNPNSRTCPTFRSGTDAELAKAVYRQMPVLIDESTGQEGNPWGISFLRMFDMANDSGVFLDAPGADRLPLYEGKMIHQFDHRFGTYLGQTVAQANKGFLPQASGDQKANPEFVTQPRYWVDAAYVDARLADRWSRGWLLGWRDVTLPSNERTIIASLMPRSAVGHNMPIAISADPHFPLLAANLNSMAMDWEARQKVGGMHLTYGILEQLPVAMPEIYGRDCLWAPGTLAEWLRNHVAELVFTADELRPFARDLGWDGPPFVWRDERRAFVRAELDAAFFHLYGHARTELDHIMELFWIVRERDQKAHGHYRTKTLVLDAYDAMALSTPERPFVSRLDPPPGDPRASHPPRSGEEPGRWVPWAEVVRGFAAREPIVPPVAPRSRHSIPARTPVTEARPAKRAAAVRPPPD